MNINQNTQNILKNFSEINTNILIKPGKELRDRVNNSMLAEQQLL